LLVLVGIVPAWLVQAGAAALVAEPAVVADVVPAAAAAAYAAHWPVAAGLAFALVAVVPAAGLYTAW
jgi:hypothetical protein